MVQCQVRSTSTDFQINPNLHQKQDIASCMVLLEGQVILPIVLYLDEIRRAQRSIVVQFLLLTDYMSSVRSNSQEDELHLHIQNITKHTLYSTHLARSPMGLIINNDENLNTYCSIIEIIVYRIVNKIIHSSMKGALKHINIQHSNFIRIQ